MIRQSMEWSIPCNGGQCARCQSPTSPAVREQVLALSAAAAFLLCGLSIILLEGGLFTAVTVGLAAAACAMVLTSGVIDRLDARRLRMCGDL